MSQRPASAYERPVTKLINCRSCGDRVRQFRLCADCGGYVCPGGHVPKRTKATRRPCLHEIIRMEGIA